MFFLKTSIIFFLFIVPIKSQILEELKQGKENARLTSAIQNFFLICYNELDGSDIIDDNADTLYMEAKCCGSSSCFNVMYEQPKNKKKTKINKKQELKKSGLDRKIAEDILNKNVLIQNEINATSPFKTKSLFLTCYRNSLGLDVSYDINKCSGHFLVEVICCTKDKCVEMLFEEEEELCFAKTEKKSSQKKDLENPNKEKSGNSTVEVTRDFNCNDWVHFGPPTPDLTQYVEFAQIRIGPFEDSTKLPSLIPLLLCQEGEGNIFRIGIVDSQNIKEDARPALIDVCFSRVHNRPYWSKHYMKLGPENPEESDRPGFSASCFRITGVNEAYTNSGWDRGHYAPNADFDNQIERGATFFYINAAPQAPAFNQGAWATLEDALRCYARFSGQFFEIYTGSFGLQAVLNNGIIVPEYFLKIVFYQDQAVVFLGINQDQAPNNWIIEWDVPTGSGGCGDCRFLGLFSFCELGKIGPHIISCRLQHFFNRVESIKGLLEPALRPFFTVDRGLNRAGYRDLIFLHPNGFSQNNFCKL